MKVRELDLGLAGPMLGDGDRQCTAASPGSPNRRMRLARAAAGRRLQGKDRRTRPTSIDQPEVRSRIAEAVHHAVCELTETDGFGLCMLYAIAGAGLLGRVFGRKFHPQAGSMFILAYPPHGWVSMDASNFEGGEFHCWLAAPTSGDQVELIDFTARHYRGYCERLTDMTGFDLAGPGLFVRRDEHSEGFVRPSWNRQDPPPYIWTEVLPTEWLKLVPDRRATEAVWSMIAAHLHEYEPLVGLAVEHFHRSGAPSGLVCVEGRPIASGR